MEMRSAREPVAIGRSVCLSQTRVSSHFLLRRKISWHHVVLYKLDVDLRFRTIATSYAMRRLDGHVVSRRFWRLFSNNDIAFQWVITDVFNGFIRRELTLSLIFLWSQKIRTISERSFLRACQNRRHYIHTSDFAIKWRLCNQNYYMFDCALL